MVCYLAGWLMFSREGCWDPSASRARARAGGQASRADAGGGGGDAPRRIRLAMLQSRPIYYILPRGRRWLGVFADNGELLKGVTPDTALRIATDTSGFPKGRYLGSVSDIDQWTLTNSLNLLRPLYRLRLDDAAGTELYVS